MIDISRIYDIDMLSQFYVEYPEVLKSSEIAGDESNNSDDDWNITEAVLDATTHCLSNIKKSIRVELLKNLTTIGKEYFNTDYIGEYIADEDKEEFIKRFIDYVNAVSLGDAIDFYDYEMVCRVLARWILEQVTFFGRDKQKNSLHMHALLCCYYTNNYDILFLGGDNEVEFGDFVVGKYGIKSESSFIKYYLSSIHDLKYGNELIHDIFEFRMFGMKPDIHETGFLCLRLNKFFDNSFNMQILLESFRRKDGFNLCYIKGTDSYKPFTYSKVKDAGLIEFLKFSSKLNDKDLIFNSKTVEKYKNDLLEILYEFYKSLSGRGNDDPFIDYYENLSSCDIIVTALFFHYMQVFMGSEGIPHIEFHGSFLREYGIDISELCRTYENLFISIGAIYILRFVFATWYTRLNGDKNLRKKFAYRLNNGGLSVSDFEVYKYMDTIAIKFKE